MIVVLAFEEARLLFWALFAVTLLCHAFTIVDYYRSTFRPALTVSDPDPGQ